MVLIGGIGVLVVVAFVAAVAFGRDTTTKPGDRIGVIPARGTATGIAILVGRCEDERVHDVGVRVPGGAPVWHIRSDKGGINRSYVLGATPPFGFATTTPFTSLPAGPLEIDVTVDRSTDTRTFDPAHLDDEGAVGAPCGERDLGVVPVLFIIGAIGVIVAYGVMVRRFLVTR
jgi:hypothetical protein